MRTVFILFFIVSVAASAQKIDRTVTYQYSDDVEFKIRKISKKRAVERGFHTTTLWHISEKGGRFIEIAFEFKNNSSENQIIDFEKAFLMDEEMQLHEVNFVTMNFKLSGSNTIFKQKLKRNSKRLITVAFTRPFPKDEKIKTLIMGENVYYLQYGD